ncbi:hypothetical protein [Pseudomonas lundensis]|uniref:hypothetical protein n=1 Tax=Pseudomonas lundensis TaxID=86185 RepID=UPI000BA23562|nr:hypothetical protein [Pseudomonas lundensis]OZY45877.1 hypothetical protein CJF41_13115 [Pseudomonas lundensis]
MDAAQLKASPETISSRKSFNSDYMLGLLVVVLMLTISFLVRYDDFKKTPSAQNMEASYHVILTMNALKESPATSHWLLPTISLGNNLDKNIPWGGTIPTKTGDYIYTSFTSYGFLAPYFIFNTLNINYTLENLAKFNFFIGGLSAIVLYSLISQLLLFSGFGLRHSILSALAGTAIAIFSREALLSHGVLYWVHSFYQIILISSLFILFKYLSSKDQRTTRIYATSLIALSFFGAATEWTGYIFNAGIFFVLLYDKSKLSLSKRLAVKIFAATFIAGLLTLVHYGLATGFEASANAFVARFLSRSTSAGSFAGLLDGYVLSYGFFILTIAAFLLITALSKNKKIVHLTVFWSLLIASCVPLLENIIMLQHAQQFSFDRLKFIFPAALTIALCFALLGVKLRLALIICLLASSIFGVYSYNKSNESYSLWSAMDSENKELKTLISKDIDIKCAIFATNTHVRAYTNILFHRGVYEYKLKPIVLDKKTEACGSVYLNAVVKFTDLPEFLSASILNKDNKKIKYYKAQQDWIRTEGDALLLSETSAYNLSDSTWTNGISKTHAAFFVDNTPRNLESISIGNTLIFEGSKNREVVDIAYAGQYINIFVSGGLLNPNTDGYPKKIQIVRN